MEREQVHHYEVVEVDDGFDVIPREEDRTTVRVRVDQEGFWNIEKRWATISIPLFGFRLLLKEIVDDLYLDWYGKPKRRQGWKVKNKIKTWAEERTSKALNKPVHELWEKRISELDHKIVSIHKRMFSIAAGRGNWSNIRRLFRECEDEYLISDIFKYRSAALAVLFGESEEWIKNWKTVFSTDGAYTSLNKTLTKLPGGIPPALIVNNLRNIRLPEPVTSRIRLYAYLRLSENPRFYANEELINSWMKIILRSTDDEIKQAVRLVLTAFPNKFTKDLRSGLEVGRAFGLMYDYLGSWDNISMLGLARRTIEYHNNIELQRRLQEEERVRQWTRRAKENEKLTQSNTALPKIELPKDKHINLISTYRDVVEEGRLMNHCIAQYAERAVRGQCYLFHVDYNDEMASVEVSPTGFVKQSYGPHDTINSASEYGRRVLSQWAKKLQ
jgi:hypothetical protein